MKTVPEVNTEDGGCTVEIWRVKFTQELAALEEIMRGRHLSSVQHSVAAIRATKLRRILFGEP